MKRILVVDDESTFRELFTDLLEDEGYLVETAADGEIALQRIMDGGYDLILLDIIMPHMDGITVLRRLQEMKPKAPNGQIVMLSVLEETDFIKTSMKLGAAGYINKSGGSPADIAHQISLMINHDK